MGAEGKWNFSFFACAECLIIAVPLSNKEANENGWNRIVPVVAFAVKNYIYIRTTMHII